ncbi:MAG: hypothetical protein Q7S53_05125 [bacterium]|nr:hypothetical protein [bacterium]
MSMFCHGKVSLKTKADKEDVLEDARRRICDAIRPKIILAAMRYRSANGDSADRHDELTDLSAQFLSNGGTVEELDKIINWK